MITHRIFLLGNAKLDLLTTHSLILNNKGSSKEIPLNPNQGFLDIVKTKEPSQLIGFDSPKLIQLSVKHRFTIVPTNNYTTTYNS